jgi:hypothetical protein
MNSAASYIALQPKMDTRHDPVEFIADGRQMDCAPVHYGAYRRSVLFEDDVLRVREFARCQMTMRAMRLRRRAGFSYFAAAVIYAPTCLTARTE